MKPYLYHALAPGDRNVRLLQLLPGSDLMDIRCEIFYYTINIVKPFGLYEALSYCWGDATNCKKILVKDRDNTNYRELEVTINLFSALQRLRDPMLPRTLWIDAICINQSDLLERGQQVQLMATIYASASQVLVWLGDSQDFDDAFHDFFEAFETIRHIADHSIVLARNVPNALHKLLSRKWFRRIWILQEITAARSLSIMYGDEELPGMTFVRGIENLFPTVVRPDPILKSYIPAIIKLMASASPLPSRHLTTQTLNIAPLGELIEMFHTNGATDRRGKVYALLGLSSDSNAAHALRPNYKKPWVVLFGDLIEHLLGSNVSSLTWNESECAVISAVGCPIGTVDTVLEHSIIVSSMKYHNPNRPHKIGWSATWSIRRYCKEIKKGDILCLLKGAQYPTIVRPCQDHFDVIVVALASTPDVTLCPETYGHRVFEQPALEITTRSFVNQIAIHHHQNFMLLWDWQHPNSDTCSSHASLLSEWDLGQADISRKHSSSSELMTSRTLAVIRILDDLWQHDKMYQIWQKWREVSTSSSDPRIEDPFTKLQYCDNIDSYRWLKNHIMVVRRCIGLLQSGSLDGAYITDTDSLLRYWADKSNIVSGILDFYAISDCENIIASMYDSTQYEEDMPIEYSPSYWEFGEGKHKRALLGFSTYQTAISVPDAGTTLPQNGRYIIDLLLAKVDRESISTKVLTEAVFKAPFVEPIINIALLAILLRVSNHRLPIDDQLIDALPLNGADQSIAMFVYNELSFDETVARIIFSRVLEEEDENFTFQFFRMYGKHIVEQLNVVDVNDWPRFRDDPYIGAFDEHSFSNKYQITSMQFSETTAAMRNEAVDYLRRYIKDWTDEPATLLEEKWKWRKN